MDHQKTGLFRVILAEYSYGDQLPLHLLLVSMRRQISLTTAAAERLGVNKRARTATVSRTPNV